MLIGLLMKAEKPYPSKTIIGKDTVICSTVAQQNEYLSWYYQKIACDSLINVSIDKIGLMDSVINAQSKTITIFETQEQTYNLLIDKMDNIQQTQFLKYSALEAVYNAQAKKEKKRSLISGLSFGVITIGLTGLLIFKLIK